MNTFNKIFRSSSARSNKSDAEEKKKVTDSPTVASEPYGDQKAAQQNGEPSVDSRKSYDLQMEQMKVLGTSDAKGASAGPSEFKNAQYSNINERQATDESLERNNLQMVQNNVAVDDNQFFVTGVEARYQQKSAGNDDNKAVGSAGTEQNLLGERAISNLVDKYKIVAVVDAPRTLTPQECVFVNRKKSVISHLSASAKTQFQFDELIQSYDQVYKIGHSLAYNFVNNRLSNKVVLNMADVHATNNNAGFNLANFKPRFLRDYFDDVVTDYERSFLGAFTAALIEHLLPESGCELYFSMAKFQNNMGFSLTQNKPDSANAGFVGGTNQEVVETDNENTIESNVPKNGIRQEDNIGGEIMPVGAEINNEVAMIGKKILSHQERRQRRNELLKKGAIPEFVPLREMYQVYQIFTEVNMKNKLLVKHQLQQQQNQHDRQTGPLPQSAAAGQGENVDEETLDLRNVKEDIILVQFKLVRKDTLKVHNTISFVNLPQSRASDVNMSTLLEIMSKQTQNPHKKMSKFQNDPQQANNFMPYNKSILTRILYDQLKKQNTLVISHFPRRAISKTLNNCLLAANNGPSTGPAKGLFNLILKLGFSTHMKKLKVTHQEAFKLLQKQFKSEMQPIMLEINKFREGFKSFETYTEQQQYAQSNNTATGLSNFTMFHQMLYFLNLKDDMTSDASELFRSHDQIVAPQIQSAPIFPALINEEEIQKVIFDQDYLRYLADKEEPVKEFNDNIHIQSKGTFAAGPTSGHTMSQIAQNQQQGKSLRLQHVQYECIKSELKDEYDRRKNHINKKFVTKTQVDPSYRLLNAMSFDEGQGEQCTGGLWNDKVEIGQNNAPNYKNVQPGPHWERHLAEGATKNVALKKTELQNMRTAKRRLIQEFPGQKEGTPSSTTNQVSDKTADRQQFYRFFLDNAQRAINMMIVKHKETNTKERSNSAIMKQYSTGAASNKAYSMNQRPINRINNDNRLQKPLFTKNSKGVTPGEPVQRAFSNYGTRVSVNLPSGEIDENDEGNSIEPGYQPIKPSVKIPITAERVMSGKPLVAPKRRHPISSKQPRESASICGGVYLKRGQSGNPNVLKNVLKNRDYSTVGGRVKTATQGSDYKPTKTLAETNDNVKFDDQKMGPGSHMPHRNSSGMIGYMSQPNLADTTHTTNIRAAIANHPISAHPDNNYNSSFNNKQNLQPITSNRTQGSRPRSKDYNGFKSLRSQGALRHFALVENEKNQANVRPNLPPMPTKAVDTSQQQVLPETPNDKKMKSNRQITKANISPGSTGKGASGKGQSLIKNLQPKERVLKPLNASGFATSKEVGSARQDIMRVYSGNNSVMSKNKKSVQHLAAISQDQDETPVAADDYKDNNQTASQLNELSQTVHMETHSPTIVVKNSHSKSKDDQLININNSYPGRNEVPVSSSITITKTDQNRISSAYTISQQNMVGGINQSAANLVLTQGTMDSAGYSSVQDDDDEALNNRELIIEEKEVTVEPEKSKTVAFKSEADVVSPEEDVYSMDSPVLTSPGEPYFRNTEPQ